MKLTITNYQRQQEIWTKMSRTEAQFHAVSSIISKPDFACVVGSNPFAKEVGDYTGPFVFTFFTNDNKLHSVKINKKGRVIAAVSA